MGPRQMRWMSGILAWRNYLFSASTNKASEGNRGPFPLFCSSILLLLILLFILF
jgi:hypothetical protein